MLKLFRVLSVALVATFAAGSARAIDPFFPTFGNNGIDVIHYGLDLDVTPATGRLQAKASLLIFAQTRLTSFKLDLHGLTVSKATVNGVTAAFSQASDKLTIKPRRAIPRGAVFLLAVDYAGTPTTIQDPTVPGDTDYQLGWFRYGDVSYVVSEPVGASTFYPANDEPTDKASFTTSVTVPSAYTGVANGALRSVRAIGMKKRFVWEMRQPMTTWLATVHVNKFRLNQTRAADGTPILVYSTPATPAADVAGYALAGKMLTYFERLIGPYPFASYGSVVVDDPVLYYALETQAMTTFALGVHGREDFVSHELAHQWFGNSVSVKNWKDLWIAEGGATYFELLWPNRNDPAGFKAAMEDNYDYIVEQDVGPAVIDSPENLFSDAVYYRGAAVLYALQLKVGTPTFFRILRTFQAVYRGGNASTEDFIRTAVVVSRNRSVGPYLRHWLYDDAVPALPGYTAASGAAASAAAANDDCRPARHHSAACR